ncbi:class I adenylate-forming enzyme family protein [Lentzea sp. NPDC060358]|uniref:class I adenylate-forming enzyme family protein n=1 Tax=Lentzea sp. NPDC060358 TaxID=3347103 RepID=UPI0036516F92
MSDVLGTLFANAGRRFHDSVAVLAGGQSRTFGEVVEQGWRLVHALRDRGVEPGSSVAAMLGANRVESLEVYVGLALGGYTAVHVNDRLTPPEVDHVVSDSGAVALVHTDGPAAVAAAATTTAGLTAWFAIGGDPPAGAESYAAALSAASPEPVRTDVFPEDTALVGYTSGTTGFPKGVLVSHRAVVNCIKLVPYAYRFPLRGHAAFPGGWSFVSGLWGVIFPHFYTGSTVAFIPGATPDEWGRHMVEHKATFTLGLTPLIPGLMAALRAHPAALDTLQSVLHSGGPLPPELAADLVALIDDRLVETYGMTEVVGPITITNRADWRGGGEADDIFASVGRPLPTSSMWVAGADGTPLPAGEIGELVIEADTMFSGYHNAPDKTAEALRDGAYHTGDLGYRDKAGYFYLTGRAQELIVTGGANVYPAEVERVLLLMDDVVEAAVFGLPDERWGEAVSAAVVLRPGATTTADEVREFARSQLAGFKKPVHLFFLGALPRNAAMKVMKHVLKEQVADSIDTTGGQR